MSRMSQSRIDALRLAVFSAPPRPSRRPPLTTVRNVVTNLDAILIEAHRNGVIDAALANRISSALATILGPYVEQENH